MSDGLSGKIVSRTHLERSDDPALLEIAHLLVLKSELNEPHVFKVSSALNRMCLLIKLFVKQNVTWPKSLSRSH